MTYVREDINRKRETTRKNGKHGGGNRLTKRERKLNMAEVIENTTPETTPETKPVVPAKSAEDRVKELEAALAKQTAALTRSNSEAADYKRQLREKQTEQERIEAERAERDRQRDELLAQYQAKERISTYKAKLMDAGIDAKSADIMAQGLPDGVTEDYFTALKTFNDTQRTNYDIAALNKQPSLSVGLPPTSMNGKTEEDKMIDRMFGL